MNVPGVEILGEVGRGGFAVVYRGRAADGRPVAVKLVHRFRGERALLRFDRERRLLAELGEDKGFVPILAAGECEKGPYVVMPFVPGGTLRARLDRGPFAVDETVRLGRALATALGRAHELGIVHRDLKPENVLFAGDGRPLVADLGLAKHFDRDVRDGQSVALSKTGELVGSAGYVAPEQLRSAREAGPPADVFSLGAILYECLTGEPAFSAGSELETFARISSGQHETIGSRRGDAPRWLERTIERALHVDPERRFRDGHALAAALVAPPPSRLPVRAFLALAAGAVVVAGVAVGSAVVLGPAARPRVVPAVPGPTPPRPAPATDRGGRARALAESAENRLFSRDFQGAQRDATSAIELDEGLARAWVVRGRALLELDDAPGARVDLDRAIELDGRQAVAFAWRAEARRRAGDLAGSVSDATESLRLDAAPFRAWLVRGMARHRLRQRAEAVSDLDEAVARAPRDPTPWVVRATARTGGASEGLSAVAEATMALALDPRQPVAWSLRALARYDLGDLDGADADALVAVGLDPRVGRAACVHANVLARRGKLDEALETFDRVIARDPDPFALCWRAAVRRQAGRPDLALEDLEAARRLDPSFPVVHLELGATFVREGKLDAAIEALTRALELDPALVEAWGARASARIRKGQHAAALADLEEGLRLAPGSAWLWCTKAAVLEETHALAEAEAALTRAVELEPREVRILAQRAWVRAALGKRPLALEDADRIVELAPASPGAWGERSGIRKRLGDASGAADDMGRSAALAPLDADRTGTWGMLLAQAGRHDEAIAADTLAIAREPRGAWLWWNRAASRRSRGDPDGAIADLTVAITLDPRNAKPWGDRALALIDKGDRAAALPDLDRATELDPKAAEYSTQRAYCLHELRRFAEAEVADGKALELSPRNAWLWRHRALTRLKLARRREALEDYDRAIEVDPAFVYALRERSKLRLELGQGEGALADARSAVERAPRDPYAWDALAAVQVANGDRAALEEALGKVLEVATVEAGARELRAERLLDSGQDERAVVEATLVLARVRSNLARVLRAEARFRLGDPGGALADADEAIRTDRLPLRSWVLRSRVLRDREDLAGARDALDRCLALDPGWVPALRARASLRAAEGDRAGAVADLEKALEVDGETVRAREVREELARARGK